MVKTITNKKSLQGNKKYKEEPNGNLEMKNTIANNYHHSAAERGGQEGHQWMKPSNMRSQPNGRGRTY